MASCSASSCSASSTLTFGTACSGTDLAWVMLDTIMGSTPFKEAGLRIQHVFSCEFAPWKRSWILANFSPKHLFGDASCLADGKAHCFVSDDEVEVPSVFLFAAGPSCKSVSNANKDQDQFADCVANENGSTGLLL